MSGIERPREFGTLVCGADYVVRPGGYAVIRRPTGEIAVLMTSGFYLAEVIASDGTGGEADHILSWLPPEEAARQLSHESQRWAVAKACRLTDSSHGPEPPEG